MSIYLLMAVDVKDPDLYAQYVEGAGKVLQSYDIKRLSFDANPTLYEGAIPANKVAILEFESQEKFDEFYNSDAYQQVIGIRHAASETKFIMTMKPFGA